MFFRSKKGSDDDWTSAAVHDRRLEVYGIFAGPRASTNAMPVLAGDGEGVLRDSKMLEVIIVGPGRSSDESQNASELELQHSEFRVFTLRNYLRFKSASRPLDPYSDP